MDTASCRPLSLVLRPLYRLNGTALPLAYTIGLPNAKTEGEDLQDELMEGFDRLGGEGVRGSQGVRGLLKGKRGRDVDKARDELLQLGMVKRDKDGRAWVYTSVTDNE